jgi:protein TonB
MRTMNAATRPLKLHHASQRPGNRLPLALGVAVLLHALLLCISFDLHKPGQLSKTLEVTLASFKSEQAPKQADYLAQHNQQGSGALEHKAVPTITEEAPVQHTEVKPVAIPSAPIPRTETRQQPKAAVATHSPQREKTLVKQERRPVQAPPPAVNFDRDQLSSEIASLEAEVAEQQQLYAKRPKTFRINAVSARSDPSAWYKNDWRKKVERVGNQNYPDAARRQGIYGSLRLLVTIKRDGSLVSMQIIESSGQPILDQAAQRIVRLAAPFAPFSGELAEYDRLEIVRTWRFERGDQLSSQ